jgi:anaerobic dimethyl sulfoxide reductase subunit B
MGRENRKASEVGGRRLEVVASNLERSGPPTVRRPVFFVDMQTCTGCKTCMVACKDKNDLGPGIRWRRVYEYSGGEWFSEPDGTFRQDVFAYYLSVSCNHCERPICVEVCPTTAMAKGKDGIVTVDENKCVGCRYCEWACPYGAPQYQVDRGVMTKCDFCTDELKAGGIPACVAACPTRALTFGESNDPNLKSLEVPDPLPDPHLTDPRALFKPHRRCRPAGSTAGRITNPEENSDE